MNDFNVFTGFFCGHSDLDDYLHNDAEKHVSQFLAVTYALTLEGSPEHTLAFASLLNDAAKMDKRFRRRLPRACHYSVYPAVKIGRLGVRQEVQGQHIGAELLDIICYLFLTDNRTGCRLVTVDAYRQAASFYAKKGFQFFNDDDSDDITRAMYLDLVKFRNSISDIVI